MTVTATYTRAHDALHQTAQRGGLRGIVDARVLVAILEHPGQATSRTITQDILADQRTDTGQVRRALAYLERKGLVLREPGETRRVRSPGRPASNVSLTLEGARLARWAVRQATKDTTT